MIIAKFDGSHRKHVNGEYSIGIGWLIKDKDNDERIHGNNKYILAEKLGSEFAESIALIELLEKLHNYKNRQIKITGDCKGIIESINNGKHMKKIKIQSEYIALLIDELREHNEVELEWAPRELNKMCDKLSKEKEEFQFSDKTVYNNPINITIKAYNEEDAKNKFQKITTKINDNEIKQKQNKKQKSINSMIKEWKKCGVSYAR